MVLSTWMRVFTAVLVILIFRHVEVSCFQQAAFPVNVAHVRSMDSSSALRQSRLTTFLARPGTNKTVETLSIEETKKTNLVLEVNNQKAGDLANEFAQLLPDQTQKNTMFLLLWTVAMLSALDRVAMSVAIVPFSQEMGYSDTTKGAISSLFSVGYGLAIVPSGFLVGSLSPRLVMAFGIFLWSIGTIATPASAGFVSIVPLLAVRATVGAAESVVLPTVQRLLSSWATSEEKAKSLAFVFTGFSTGTMIAYLLSPYIIENLGGWRDLFYVYGFGGLILLVPWLLLAQDSPTSQENTMGLSYQPKVIDDPQPEASTLQKSLDAFKAAPWLGFLQSKGAWAMLLSHCANNWGLYNILAWTPTFYYEQYGLSVQDSAVLLVLPSLAGATGGLLAGNIADYLIRNFDDDEAARDQYITNVRKFFQGFALFGSGTALFYLSSNIPEQPWVAQTLLMAVTGMKNFNAAGYLAANQEKAGKKWGGLLYSITSLPAVMVGTLGVYTTGQILDATNKDWSIVFGLNAGINMLGAAAFVLLYNSKREFD